MQNIWNFGNAWSMQLLYRKLLDTQRKFLSKRKLRLVWSEIGDSSRPSTACILMPMCEFQLYIQHKRLRLPLDREQLALPTQLVL